MINRKTTLALIDQINELMGISSTGTELDVVLYYSSQGGEVHWANYQADLLNRCLEHFKLEIFTGAAVMSAAIRVLKNFKGKVIVDDMTVGMIHNVSSSINTKDLNNEISYDTFILKDHRRENNRNMSGYKNHLTLKECETYNKGMEVFLSAPRLRKIINENKKPLKKITKVKTIENEGS